MPQMKSAWVITQEGIRHNTIEVVGVLSARKSGRAVKEYVEWLYALLHYVPQEHLQFAGYTKPTLIYEAEFWTTNTGVPTDRRMHCGHDPYLVARRANNISLLDPDDGAPFLKWTEPNLPICDPTSGEIVATKAGKTMRARVHLPLQITGSCRRVAGVVS